MTQVTPLSTSGIRNSFAYLAWTAALAGTLGSLFFSEVMELPPCALCWYQRIAMYPLVIILAVGIVRRDQNLKAYALPFSVIGLGIAIYHNLLYYGVIAAGITPCSEGVPCTAVQIEWLGFLTIPLMGLAGFLTVTLFLLFYKAEEQ